MTKICLHTVQSLNHNYGGPSTSVPALCTTIDRIERDCKTQVFTLGRTEDTNGEGRYADSFSHTVTCSSSTLQRELLHAVKFGREVGPTVIMHDHGQWLYINRLSAALSRKMKIPRIVSPRGMLSPWAMSQKLWKKRLAWFLYGRRDLASAGMIHATSELEARDIQRLRPGCPIVVVPNGVAIETDFVAENKAIQKGSRPYVLFMSRIHKKKGIEELLAIWNKLGESGWDLVIAGPDEQGLLTGRSMPPNAQYIGAVGGDKKRELLQRASLFVLPTYSENFGIVVAEALAAMVPVITTHGAPWHGLIENRCGWWIPMELPALSCTLAEAMSKPMSELATMGRRGHVWMKKEFDWSVLANRVIDCYEWLLSRTNSSPPWIVD